MGVHGRGDPVVAAHRENQAKTLQNREALWTIGALAKRVGLARSTLLYYDALGLLPPCGRTAAGYRLYSEASAERLERLCAFRAAGMPLAHIRRLLDAPSSDPVRLLEERLTAIAEEMRGLRRQQRWLLRLLAEEGTSPPTNMPDKNAWVSMLRTAGLKEEGLDTLHVLFERRAPEAHQDFLESLGLQEAEIRALRAISASPSAEETPPPEQFAPERADLGPTAAVRR